MADKSATQIYAVTLPASASTKNKQIEKLKKE